MIQPYADWSDERLQEALADFASAIRTQKTTLKKLLALEKVTKKELIKRGCRTFPPIPEGDNHD